MRTLVRAKGPNRQAAPWPLLMQWSPEPVPVSRHYQPRRVPASSSMSGRWKSTRRWPTSPAGFCIYAGS